MINEIHSVEQFEAQFYQESSLFSSLPASNILEHLVSI